MIEFKSFVEAVHRSVSDAAEAIGNKNKELLERYFTKSVREDGSEILEPRMVKMSVPELDEDGNMVDRTVSVPLVSLVPFASSQIEKATFSAEFRLFTEDGKLCLAFPGEKLPKGPSTSGRLEVTISPTESTEGIQRLIDAYNDALTRQL